MEKPITINNSHLFAKQNMAKQQLNPGEEAWEVFVLFFFCLYKSKSLKMKGENENNNITIRVWKDMYFLRISVLQSVRWTIHQTLPEDHDELKYWIPKEFMALNPPFPASPFLIRGRTELLSFHHTFKRDHLPGPGVTADFKYLPARA